ncbi:histidine phosphatase family protein [Candidatus Saccharibacteria bacterium]|nr:histidine phosphatase family protein [Candidatus Saccharibacteria bacterium]
MEVILVRHGLTKNNKLGITNGRIDEPLAEEGKIQAQELAQRLKDKPIDVIYSSPLKRATLTALPIAEKLGKTINIDRRLIEVDFGSFEGKPHREVKEVLGDEMRGLFNKYEYDLTPYDGESSAQVEERVKAFYGDLKQQPYEMVLVVTHGGILRWLHYLITGEKIGPLPNGEELHLKN